MKIFSGTILGEPKRPQTGWLSPKGEFPVCSGVSFRMVEKIFGAAKSIPFSTICLIRTVFVKIELIVPAVEENARVPNLALPILAALTPPDVKISVTDDLLTPIDLVRDLKEVDLVGITVLTKTALRAYQIADAYRKKGVVVVLGGIHPSALPEEAKEHADAVVIGEAEEIGGALMEDMRAKNLKLFYRQEGYIDPKEIPRPRRDIFPAKGYFPLDVVQVTRGCPFRCEFCSVRKFFGDTYRFRPISEVVEEA